MAFQAQGTTSVTQHAPGHEPDFLDLVDEALAPTGMTLAEIGDILAIALMAVIALQLLRLGWRAVARARGGADGAAEADAAMRRQRAERTLRAKENVLSRRKSRLRSRI